MAERKRSIADAVPSSSVGGRICSDQAKLQDLEALFDRVKKQLNQHAQFPKIDEPSKVIEESKVTVQKLLMLPMQEVLLPQNYTSLVDALPYYAASHLSAEKAQAVEEFQNKLPSLFTEFHKLDKKSLLIDELKIAQECHNDLKHRRTILNNKLSEIRRQKRAIEDEEDYCSSASEELGAESDDQP